MAVDEALSPARCAPPPSAPPSPSSERILVGVRVRPCVIPGSAPLSACQASTAASAWLIDTERAELQLTQTPPPHHPPQSEASTSTSSPAAAACPASPLPSASGGGGGGGVGGSGGAACPVVYSFDCVFPPSTADLEVYERLVAPLVDGCLRGIHGTVFAYGQTSSGKTHTMSGMRRLAASHLFRGAEALTGWQVRVTASFVEVHNEQLRDLLAPLCASSSSSARLRVREHPTLGVHIPGLREEEVADAAALLGLAALADSHRAVASTAMNDRSSRSHSICRISIRSCADRERRHSVLQLIDLAGSERCAVSQTSGARLKEGGHINRSLLTLSTVIGKLSARSSDAAPASASPSPPPSLPSPSPLPVAQSSAGLATPHIPYRDSTLTRILQPALGGNSRTAIIACINEWSGVVDESVSTLRFALQAKQVRTSARVNAFVDPKDAEIAQLQRRLREQSEAELRWRRKFHRLSSQMHITQPGAVDTEVEEETEREQSGEGGRREEGAVAGGGVVCSSPLPLCDIVEEGGEEDDEEERRLLEAALQRRRGEEEGRERSRREWGARMRDRLVQLQRSLTRSLCLTEEARAPAADEQTPLAATDDATPTDLEALVDRLSALVGACERRREAARAGMASSLVAVRSLQLRCGELRADVDGCRAALCADGLQLHTAWREQQAQVRLMCEEQRRRAAQREAELQAQLHSAQEAHAELSSLLQRSEARAWESRRRVEALEAESAAVSAELHRTRRLVPTPAMLQQLAKATRSVQAAVAAAAPPGKADSERGLSQRHSANQPLCSGQPGTGDGRVNRYP